MDGTRTLGTVERGSAAVDDVIVRGPDGLDFEAYLVRPAIPAGAPAAGQRGPGLVLWHWLDSKAPDGNRTQYLDEAIELAGYGVVSLLPQGRFPWTTAPSGAVADASEIEAEVARLRACLDLLETRADVDPSRLGIVGHDFGGMLATLAAASGPRLAALVVVAATPRWGDWVLPFWEIADDRIEYLTAIRRLDPIERIAEANAEAVLLQFADHDFYIAPMTALEFHGAAPGAALLRYETGHDMRLPEIRADRRAFLARTLGFDTA